MNILIIGNGFDLAHGLPTIYKDFLEFINDSKNDFYENVKQYYPYENDNYFNDIEFPDNYKDFIKKPNVNYPRIAIKKCSPLSSLFSVYKRNIYRIFSLNQTDSPSSNDGIKIAQNIFDEDETIKYNSILLWAFLKGNLWFDYFNKKVKEKSMMGENWIDFESEISTIIRILEKTSLQTSGQNKEAKDVTIRDILLKNVYVTNPKDFTRRLEDDLDILIKCLEVYLLLINKFPINNINKNIVDTKADKVISFNYTNIYLNNYNTIQKNDIDFIHGEAGKDNIVLGIEETFEDEKEINNNLTFIKFKKYFQRIYKKTGLKYKDWLENANDKKLDEFFNDSTADKIKHNIYIFGHSLDVTDKDILNYIILHKNVGKTTIYYYNEEAYAQQITNLVKVIGKDELIEFVGDKKIEFIKQSNDIVKI